MIVGGDIGGTHARLGLFEIRDGVPALVTERNYASTAFSGLEAVLRTFIDELHPVVDAAAFGLAGPVRDGRVKTPNLPWEVGVDSLQSVLGVSRVSLINDLEALAYGIPLVQSADLAVLNQGVQAAGNQAVVAAGTGFGVAGLVWDGKHHKPLATEGGHADFAPRNVLESELMLHLSARFGRVSNERILSGPGLLNVYEFLRDTGRAEEPEWLAHRMKSEPPGKVIGSCGVDRSSALCSQAVDLFVAVYGAVAGNVALSFLATAGLYIGGGIGPKLLPRLLDPTLFRAAFVDKGRLTPMLERVPVKVILDGHVGMRGAAQVAAESVSR